MEFFLQDTLKTTFWMENLTQRLTLSGLFFPTIRALFMSFKKEQGRTSSIPPPLLRTWKMVYKNVVLKKFEILNALGLQRYWKRLQNRCFPVNIAKSIRTPFLQNNGWTSVSWILKHFLVVTKLVFARRISKQWLWKEFIAIAIS